MVYGSYIFSLGLILSIVLTIKSKKWYPVAYVVSLCLYIFAVAFAIDHLDYGKNFILGLLTFSALLMILLGVYLSKQSHYD